MANAKFFNLITLDKVKEAFKKYNYSFFENGDYNLNIFSIRNTEDKDSNNFNDVLCVCYKVKDKWILDKFDCTTDPGYTSRESPVNNKGCAILVPGQYRGCWHVGLHHGKYKALVQYKPVKVYRDNNKDKKLDFDEKSIETGMFGINIHRATANKGGKSINVDNWSAGCTVIASKDDFDKFMKLVDEASKRYGDVFSYTLFKEDQVL